MFKFLPYLFANIFNFYILPIVVTKTQLLGLGGEIVTLVFIMPLLCFIVAVIYGKNFGFHLQYCIFVIIVFVPAIFLMYNSTAWVYCILFCIVALVGSFIGTNFRKSE